jgi:hypothetical protein
LNAFLDPESEKGWAKEKKSDTEEEKALLMETPSEKKENESTFLKDAIRLAMSGVVLTDNKKDNEVLLTDQFLLITCNSEKEDLWGFAKKTEVRTCLALAVFMELQMRKLITLTPKKASLLGEDDYIIQLKSKVLVPTGSSVLDEALSILYSREGETKAVRFARELTNDLPFSKGVKNLVELCVEHAVNLKLFTEEVKKGIFTDSKKYAPNAEEEKRIIYTVRVFCIKDDELQDINNLALLSLFYSAFTFGNKLGKVVNNDKFFYSKDEKQAAEKHLTEYFGKISF